MTIAVVSGQEKKLSNGSMYPYLGKNGSYGYADERMHIVIEPQYKSAGLFNEHGYAIVQDRSGKYGIIDKDNVPIVSFEKEYIRLFSLDDFTLAALHDAHHSNLRFWEWEFLPGLNLLGGGSNDNRLFDTKVERQQATIWILGKPNRKITSQTVTSSSLSSNYFHVIPLDDNQVLINGTLYDVGKKGATPVAAQIKAPLNNNTFAQLRGQSLRIIDRKGKSLSKFDYQLLTSLEFNVRDVPVIVDLEKNTYRKVTTPYKDTKGNTFIYPDFSKSLPKKISNNSHSGNLSTAEILQKSWLIYPIPKSNYFLFMDYHNDRYTFHFLDTEGNWHATIPPDIPFNIINNSGKILWPDQEYFIPANQIPDTWKVRSIKQIEDSRFYNIILRKDKAQMQGIWDFENKQWLINPEHYLIYTLGVDYQQWTFQAKKEGLWGIIDNRGKVLVKPTYNSISNTGMVRLTEQGKSLAFYLHLPTLREFRDK